jgi:hypothetical protein
MVELLKRYGRLRSTGYISAWGKPLSIDLIDSKYRYIAISQDGLFLYKGIRSKFIDTHRVGQLIVETECDVV